MNKHTFHFRKEADRDKLHAWADRCPVGWDVEFREPKRNNDQNARLWAMLTDIADQVEWYGQSLTKEDWKDILTAALKRQRAVPGVDGGFVVLGARTSDMGKQEMSELLELIAAFGSQQGVTFNDR